MAEAVFLVDIDADRTAVHEALTTHEGIVSWWTTKANREGDVMTLGFPEAPMPFDLRIDEDSESLIRWTSVGEFPPHWQGTEVRWSLNDHPEGSGTQLFFEHTGFASADPMLGHTAYTWAQLMGKLKAFAETGSADPLFSG